MALKIISAVDELKKVINESNNLVVVHFAAEWAAQCAQMTNVLEELSKDVEFNAVKFIQVDAESVAEISQKYEISSVPTIVLIKNREVVSKVQGANIPQLIKEVKIHSSDSLPVLTSNQTATSSEEALHSRLKKLINLDKCMVFMKGNRQAPQCGFSRQLISILNDMNAVYNTFDILTDNEVREGLKTYSNWPTYPQVYVNGELIGGLDIIKEMKESGDLETTIPRQSSLDERLKALVNKAEVVLFMKGNRNQPKCGFSRQTIAILDETGLAYDTFDILEDEEVRQGLKTYSNWPTYPQLYVKGNLIGGLDIIKELKDSDELLSTLKP